MLSNDVLNEFILDGLFQEYLVTLAWPSLSVESKLQIIQATQVSESYPRTLSFIFDLAINDQMPIVRYWASRYYQFTPLPLTIEKRPKFQDTSHNSLYQFLIKRKDEEIERTQKAISDECELVSIFAEQALHNSPLKADASLPAKLAIIKNKRFGFDQTYLLYWFSSYLKDEIKSNCYSSDLNACVISLLNSRWLADIRNNDLIPFEKRINGLIELWELVTLKGNKSADYMVSDLPLRINDFCIDMNTYIDKNNVDLIAAIGKRSDFNHEVKIRNFLLDVKCDEECTDESIKVASKLLLLLE